MTPSAFAERARAALARFPRARRGSTAVEFAIIAPVLVTFILGILMLGIAYHNAATIQWSLERSIRMAMIDEDVTLEEIEAAMADDLARAGSPDIALSYTLEESGAVKLAVITADYEVPLNIPLLPALSLHYSVEDVVPVPVS